MENSEQSSEQSSEQTGNEGSDQSLDTSASSQAEETQGASTGEQVDTSSEIKSNGSSVGLQKSEQESVDSGENFSENLDALVRAALNDELTNEQMEELDAGGMKGHFDMIVNGHKAQIAENDAQIVGVVGSKEAYGELQEWALSNLDDSEITSFNKAVLESGDIGLAKLAVEGLQARYHRANGQAPQKRIEAGGTANESSRPFANNDQGRDEYINETRSMKYRSDPAYAAQIEAKRNLSGF